MPKELKRRNISGIYFLDKFPSDERQLPTCIEDCRPSKRREVLMSKNKEYLRSVITSLADTFKELTDFCHKDGVVKDEYRDEFVEMANRWIERSKWNWAEHELVDQIDIICEKITMLADFTGVERKSLNDDQTITLDNNERAQNTPSNS